MSETFEELLDELNSVEVEYEIFFAHARPLPECFNEPTERALADKRVFAVLFVEDDMIIPKGVLRRMFEVEYPVTALDYPFKQNGDSTCLRDPEGFAYWTGTGFMLVSRAVLESLPKPIWRTDQTFDPFVDKDTIHFWPRKLDKVYYGLHDLNFGLILYSAGMPVLPMQQLAGQRKLVKLGDKNTNHGMHEIELLTEVGLNVVSGLVEQSNVELFLGAMNRVRNVKFWTETPPFISYDKDNQPYLNDGREFQRVQ